LALVNEGLCPNGSERYVGRPLQVTQVTPVVVVDESPFSNNKSETVWWKATMMMLQGGRVRLRRNSAGCN